MSTTMNFKYGLHARPCSLIVNALKDMDLKISDLYVNDTKIDMKSILKMLMACVPYGQKIIIILEGPDEKKAQKFLKDLFSNNKEE